jgi:hypothetical protein
MEPLVLYSDRAKKTQSVLARISVCILGILLFLGYRWSGSFAFIQPFFLPSRQPSRNSPFWFIDGGIFLCIAQLLSLIGMHLEEREARRSQAPVAYSADAKCAKAYLSALLCILIGISMIVVGFYRRQQGH